MKRKLEFSDLASVDHPEDSAFVHSFISYVFPVKVEMRDLMERKQAVVLENCQIKKANTGSNMEVILKRTTGICPSLKKF